MIYVDEMLGTISKWMLIFGKSVRYIKGIEDDEIIKLLTPQDILITSDYELCNKINKFAKCIFIKHRDKLDYNLAYIFTLLKEKPIFEPKFCSLCGGSLTKVKKREIKELIPFNVYKHHRDFYICNKCKKIYWKGTHWNKMKRFYKKVLSLMKKF